MSEPQSETKSPLHPALAGIYDLNGPMLKKSNYPEEPKRSWDGDRVPLVLRSEKGQFSNLFL